MSYTYVYERYSYQRGITRVVGYVSSFSSKQIFCSELLSEIYRNFTGHHYHRVKILMDMVLKWFWNTSYIVLPVCKFKIQNRNVCVFAFLDIQHAQCPSVPWFFMLERHQLCGHKLRGSTYYAYTCKPDNKDKLLYAEGKRTKEKSERKHVKKEKRKRTKEERNYFWIFSRQKYRKKNNY